MTMLKQKTMTDYFLKSLENETNGAKRAGKYDVGIKTLSGNKVEFVGKPRSFCFRGLPFKHERVLLYQVALDLGMDSTAAMNMYNEANVENDEAPSDNGWTSRGQRAVIKSGFYVDDRHYLRGGKKVL